MRLQRQAVVAVPEKYEPGAHSGDLLGTGFVDELTAAITVEMCREAGRPMYATVAFWVIACSEDPDRVDLVPSADECKDKPSCPTCLAGKDQARAYMAEHPGRHVAIGLITFEL